MQYADASASARVLVRVGLLRDDGFCSMAWNTSNCRYKAKRTTIENDEYESVLNDLGGPTMSTFRFDSR